MASSSCSTSGRNGGGPSEEQTVMCSICLEVVETTGPKDSVRLRCGHFFHFDCITSAFSAKGIKECPNCRDVTGYWSTTVVSDHELLHQMQLFLTNFFGRESEIAEQDQVNWDAREQAQQQAHEREWQERMQDLQAQRQELVRSREQMQEQMQELETRMREQIAHERARINQYWTAQIEQERAHSARYWTARLEQERARIAQFSTIYRSTLPWPPSVQSSFRATPPPHPGSTIAPSWWLPPTMATRVPPVRTSVPSLSMPLPFMQMPMPLRLLPEHLEPMSPTLPATRTALESSTTEAAVASTAMDSHVPNDDDVEAEDPPHR